MRPWMAVSLRSVATYNFLGDGDMGESPTATSRQHAVTEVASEPQRHTSGGAAIFLVFVWVIVFTYTGDITEAIHDAVTHTYGDVDWSGIWGLVFLGLDVLLIADWFDEHLAKRK